MTKNNKQYHWIIVFAAIIALFLNGCTFYVNIRSNSNLTSILAGGTMAFQASGRDIVWSVSSTYDGSGPVSGGTFISPNGVLTVSIDETSLILYITAVSMRERKSVPGIFQVRIVTVTELNVTTANPYAAIGRTAQFRAQVIGTNNPDQHVTWKVSSNEAGTGAVTPGTSINSNGTLSVSLNETAKTLYVFAASVVDPSKSGSAAIAVVVPVIAYIEVTSASPIVRAGSTLRFSAAATGTYEPSSSVTWRVSSNSSGTGAVTPGTSINSNGVLTVAINESLSTLFIIATSTYDNTKSASIPVTVVVPTITNISVTPANRAVRAGETLQFRSTVTGTYDPPANVTWRVSSNAAGTGAVTPGTSINSSGLLRVANNESLTSLFIIATSTYDPTKVGIVSVTVTIPTVTSVAVSPTNQTIAAGNSIQFYAAVRGTNNPNSTVTWRVSSNAAGTGAVTAGTSINANGLLTVSINETAAALFVFATSVFDPTKSGSNLVTISQNPVTLPAPNPQPPVTTTPAVPAVTAVTVSPSARTMERGTAYQFNAAVTGTNNPVTSVTWRVSSNAAGTGAVASGTSISAGGLLTVSANESVTALYVSATSTVDTTKSGSAVVTVNIPAAPVVPIVTAVAISPSTQNMTQGSSYQFSAIVRGDNNPANTVTWRVSSTANGTGSVASGTSVSSSGLLTVSADETNTTLYVIATSTVNTSISGSAAISVIILTPTVTSISISPSTQNMTTNSSYQFSAIVRGDNNPAATVTWSVSSNAAGTGSIAPGTTINANGRLTVAPNEWNTHLYVVARSTVNNSITGSAVVTITNNNANQGSNQGSAGAP